MATKAWSLYSFGFLFRNMPGMGTCPSFSRRRLESEVALGVGEAADPFSSSPPPPVEIAPFVDGFDWLKAELGMRSGAILPFLRDERGRRAAVNSSSSSSSEL